MNPGEGNSCVDREEHFYQREQQGAVRMVCSRLSSIPLRVNSASCPGFPGSQGRAALQVAPARNAWPRAIPVSAGAWLGSQLPLPVALLKSAFLGSLPTSATSAKCLTVCQTLLRALRCLGQVGERATVNLVKVSRRARNPHTTEQADGAVSVRKFIMSVAEIQRGPRTAYKE